MPRETMGSTPPAWLAIDDLATEMTMVMNPEDHPNTALDRATDLLIGMEK